MSTAKLTPSQLAMGWLETASFPTNVKGATNRNTKLQLDPMSLFNSSMQYDPVCPTAWLVFATLHVPTIARTQIFKNNYGYPVVQIDEKFKDKQGWRVRTTNRLARFYSQYGLIGNGTGISGSMQLPPAKGQSVGDWFTLANYSSDTIWFRDNERICKEFFPSTAGYGGPWSSSIGSRPGFLGDGKHTVAIGYADPKYMRSIQWMGKRDFFNLPGYQYIDLSKRDSERIVTFKLPSNFFGIEGTWHSTAFSLPTPPPACFDFIPPPYVPPQGSFGGKVALPSSLAYSIDNKGTQRTGLGFGWNLGKGPQSKGTGLTAITGSSSLNMSGFHWISPRNILPGDLWESFYLGTDGTISITKYNDYPQQIKTIRASSRQSGLNIGGWLPLNLWWIPTNNNRPSNFSEMIFHAVTVWIKY